LSHARPAHDHRPSIRRIASFTRSQ
jgi:hypothetical protein